jgi:hypothetical protein
MGFRCVDASVFRLLEAALLPRRVYVVSVFSKNSYSRLSLLLQWKGYLQNTQPQLGLVKSPFLLLKDISQPVKFWGHIKPNTKVSGREPT